MSSAVAKPALHHPDRRQDVRDEQRVDHEAGAVLAADDPLVQHVARRTPAPARRCRATVSSDVTSSTRRQHRHRVEEVDADRPARVAAVAMPSFMIGIELVLLARIAVGIGDVPVERAEHVGLQRLVLDDRLDDQLPVGELGEVGGEREAGDRLRRARPRRASRCRTPRSRLPTMRARPRSHAAASTSRTTTSSPARAHTSAMPDAHQARAHHTHTFDAHAPSLPYRRPSGHVEADGPHTLMTCLRSTDSPARRQTPRRARHTRRAAPRPRRSPVGVRPFAHVTSATRARPATSPWCSTTIASSQPSACGTPPARSA